jgi:hypothetical protein
MKQIEWLKNKGNKFWKKAVGLISLFSRKNVIFRLECQEIIYLKNTHTVVWICWALQFLILAPSCETV